MSSISGGSPHSHYSLSHSKRLNQGNQADNTNVSADATDTTQASVINPDATLPELVTMYDQVTQRIQSNDYAPPLPSNNLSMGMGRMGLLGRLIPFGLAKRSAADLPDGNPWKHSLAERDKAAADITQGQGQKAEDVALQQDLLSMILSRISGMLPADGTATDSSQSTVAVGETTTDTSSTAGATDTTTDTTVDTTTDTSTTDTTEAENTASKMETTATTEEITN